jgi:hypothetical protein
VNIEIEKAVTVDEDGAVPADDARDDPTAIEVEEPEEEPVPVNVEIEVAATVDDPVMTPFAVKVETEKAVMTDVPADKPLPLTLDVAELGKRRRSDILTPHFMEIRPFI